MSPRHQVTSERITGSISPCGSAKAKLPAPSGNHRRVSIQFWLASLVLACVVPIWIAAGFLVYHNYQSKRALTEQRTLESAQALTLDVERELANMQASLGDLSTSTAVVTGDLSDFYHEAQIFLTVAQPGAEIILSDATGQELMNTSLPFDAPLPKRRSLEAVHQVFASGLPVSADFYQLVPSDRLKISMDMPVFRKGRVVYDLAMSVPPDRFSTFLRELRLQPEWVGTIFDSHQILVARTPAAERLIGPTIGPALRKRMEDTAEGTAQVVNLGGVPIFDCFSRSKSSGWTVVIGVPKAVMMAEIWRWLTLTIIGTALLSFTGIALALLVARRIAASIQGLVAPALALGRGEAVAIGSLELSETREVGESLLKASELIQRRAAERERAEAARREADELKRFNSELELREAAARAQAKELAVIMDTVPAAMFIGHDPECKRMTSNRAACELFRLQPSYHTPMFACGEKGLHYRVIRDGRELASGEMPVQLAAATGIEIRDCECTIAFDDGSSRIIFGNAVPLLDEQGKTRGAVGAFIDITERKQAEQRIAHLASFPELNSSPIFETDSEGRVMYINPAALRQFPTLRETGAAHPLLKDWWTVVALLRASAEQSTAREVESDGRVYLQRIHYLSELEVVRAYFADITDRKQAEDALRMNEERLRLAQHGASMGVFDVELKSGKRTWSAQMFQIFGRAPDSPQPSAEDVLRICHPDDRTLVKEQLGLMSAGMPLHFEFRIIRPDGEVRWVEIFGKAMTDDAGQPIRCVGVGRDITERKQAEEYRRWSGNQLRALAMRLQTAAEQERLRIARELHDQLGQALTGMKMDLDWIVRKHGTEGGPWVSMVQDCMKVVDSTIALVRKISTELRPEVLDALGLRAAIEWHMEEFQRRTGMSCTVHVPENPLGIPGEKKIAIFRIYQEALTNIARHAKATNVLVNLEQEQDAAVLTISDDGVGFPMDRLSHTQSLGVLGMRERALLMGAQFRLQSSRDHGTTVTLRIPLEGSARSERETHEDIDR